MPSSTQAAPPLFTGKDGRCNRRLYSRVLETSLIGPKMANRSIKGAIPIHGKDPQLLIEKIIRERIYDSLYWKETCFGLNAETILDKAVELDCVGGTYANQRPVPFLCLLLKLLQIQPSLEIVEEYIQQPDFKYLRVLGLFYYRLIGSSIDVYRRLEPLLADRRKLRLRLPSGTYVLTHIDQVVDDLLCNDRLFGIILPRLTKRTVLEDTEELEARPHFFPVDSKSIDVVDHPDNNDYGERMESLSVEETNTLRAKLGLRPLENT